MAQVIALIYPWSMKDKEIIVPRFDDLGVRERETVVVQVPRGIARWHYEQHAGRDFYERIVADMMLKSVWVAQYEGDREEFTRLKLELRASPPFPGLTSADQHKNAVVHTSRDDTDFAKDLITWGRFLNKV